MPGNTYLHFTNTAGNRHAQWLRVEDPVHTLTALPQQERDMSETYPRLEDSLHPVVTRLNKALEIMYTET